MKIEKIKPIPKYILEKIQKLDKRLEIKPCGRLRFYSYLTMNDGELVKVTCAVKVYKNVWYCKQVAVHGMHSEMCFCRDIKYNYMSGFQVDFFAEGMRQYSDFQYYADGKWYDTCEDKYFHPYAPTVNPEYAYKLPEFKYSACELYKGDDIIEYLRTYEAHPQAEMLVKLGFSSYIVLSKQILTQIGKDKSFRKWLYKNREAVNRKIYYVSSIISAYKQNKTIDDIQAFEKRKKELNQSWYKSVREIAKTNYERFFAYLDKQNIGLALYRDYLRACIELNLDMTLDINRYPHDFYHFHDMRIAEMNTAIAYKNEQRRKEAEEEQKRLAEKFIAVARKFMPLQSLDNGAFVVYIAQSPSELVREGEALHHCVGKMGYDRKFAREQSLIFFVRSAEATDTPLVTIEYDIKSKSIKQCYADHNHKPDQAITDYVNNVWLPHANKQIKKIAA